MSKPATYNPRLKAQTVVPSSRFSLPRPIRRAWRGLLVVLHILTGALLGAFFIQPALMWRPEQNQSLRGKIVQWWFHRLIRILHLRLKVYGEAAVDAPAVLVANHISWVDILVLGSQIPGHFVAKAEIRDWPVIGWLCEVAGTLFIRRGQRDSTQRIIGEMSRQLRAGRNVYFFPEGTSTDGTAVKPFRRRLFQAALDTRKPVQAIAIRYPYAGGTHPAIPYIGDDTLFDRILAVLAEPEIEVELHYCVPLYPTRDTRESELAQTSGEQVQQACLKRPTAG